MASSTLYDALAYSGNCSTPAKAGHSRIMTVGFGYRYNDETGHNVQKLMEL